MIPQGQDMVNIINGTWKSPSADWVDGAFIVKKVRNKTLAVCNDNEGCVIVERTVTEDDVIDIEIAVVTTTEALLEAVNNWNSSL